MERHLEAARAAGIEIRYSSPVVELSQGEDGIAGVICRTETGRRLIEARAVVLASGGFEADPRLRAAYLGPNRDLARIRGSEYNTGAVLRLALAACAQPYARE